MLSSRALLRYKLPAPSPLFDFRRSSRGYRMAQCEGRRFVGRCPWDLTDSGVNKARVVVGTGKVPDRETAGNRIENKHFASSSID